MKTKILFSWLLIMTLTVSCKTSGGQETATSVFPALPQPSSMPSQIPINVAQEQCLEILPNLPAGLNINGSFLLSKLDSHHTTYIFHLDGTKVFLPKTANETLDFIEVSPNRRWISYYAENLIDENASRLVVTDLTGKQVFSKSISKRKWWGIDSWAGNEHLLIDKYQSMPDVSLATPLPIIVLNPFTGEEYELAPSYPDMVSLYPTFDWQEYGFSGAGYAPNLTLVAYARTDGKVVLWNVQKKHEITNIQSAATFGDGPVWNPDGSRFIIDSIPESTGSSSEDFWKEELYIVGSDGKTSRATSLTDEFDGATISGYQWSPDGQHVAFWLAVEPNTHTSLSAELSYINQLATLDLVTKKVTLYCIRGNSKVSPIVWSPDGTQLLINTLSGNTYDTVLVDIVKGFAAKIAKNTIPEGWVISEP